MAKSPFSLTLDEVKEFLVVEHEADDNLLRVLMTAAEGRAKRYFDRLIEAEEVTEYHDGGRQRLFLRNRPIGTSPAVVITDTKGSVDDATDDEVLDIWRYRVYHEAGTIRRTSRYGTPLFWPDGAQRYKVVYTGGMSLLEDWEEFHRPGLQVSIYQLVQRWYDLGAQALAKDGKLPAQTLKGALPPEVECFWEQYRPTGVGSAPGRQ